METHWQCITPEKEKQPTTKPRDQRSSCFTKAQPQTKQDFHGPRLQEPFLLVLYKDQNISIQQSSLALLATEGVMWGLVSPASWLWLGACWAQCRMNDE